MPLYNFATYADFREEWAIEADSIDHARQLIGDDANGDWLDRALPVEAYATHLRDEFLLDDDEQSVAVEEITPDHWAWRGAHSDYLEYAIRRNIAAISGNFHTHRLFGACQDMFGERAAGSIRIYRLCIAMARALTDWEAGNGMEDAYDKLGVPWIEVVESFVEDVLETWAQTGELPDPADILPKIAAG